MEPFQRLIHWIVERHGVHCKRYGIGKKDIGKPQWRDFGVNAVERACEGTVLRQETQPPWTDDPIIQSVFFCNPYRENDKVTAYLRDNFREKHKNDPCVFLGTILLRMFNYIPTMRCLINANIPQRLGTSPRESAKALDEMQKLLLHRRDKLGLQIFGGAYIIIFPPGMQKVEAAYKTMTELADAYHELKGVMFEDSMEDAYRTLIGFWGIGQFYTYQYIGDLAYTHVLQDAEDWHTWGYCGPGTARGLYRLQGITEINGVPLERRCPPPKDADDQLQDLRPQVNKELKKAGLPQMHMRDITNCLCEYDKYERALNNERRIKRAYSGLG